MASIKWYQGIELKIDVDPTDDDAFYQLDWSDWLAEVGAGTTISGVTVTSSELTISNVSFTGTTTTFQARNNTLTLGQKGIAKTVINTADLQLQPRSITFVATNL